MGLASSPPFWASASTAAAIAARISVTGPLHFHRRFSVFARPLFLPSRKCYLESWRKQKGMARKVCSCLVKVQDDISDEECELVNGVDVSIGEGVDRIHAYLLKAVKNNNGTGILLLSDIFGFEDSSTRDFAYRVACNGYNVLVPDMFRGDPWRKDRPKAMFEQWMTRQQQQVTIDVMRSAKWMVGEFLAAGISKKLGMIGFCFGGGRVIEVLREDQGAHFGTGVSFYGTRMDPSLASGIEVPVLFISGDNDPLCPVSLLDDMESRIGKESRVVIFKGRGHGFAHRPEYPEEDEDAEQAFMVMRNWLNDHLILGD